MKKLLVILAILAISVSVMAYTEGVDQSTVLADLTVEPVVVIDPDNPHPSDPRVDPHGVWLQLGGTAPESFGQLGGGFNVQKGNFDAAYNEIPKNFDFATSYFIQVFVEVSENYQWLENKYTQLSVEFIDDNVNPDAISQNFGQILLTDEPQSIVSLNRGYHGTGGLTYTFEPNSDIIPTPDNETLVITYTVSIPN